MFRLYGIPGCPNCVAAERILQQLQLPFQAIYAGGDPVIAEGVKVLTGDKDKVRVPVLVLLGDNSEVVVGFDPDKYRQIIKTFKERELANADKTFDSVLGTLNGGDAGANGKAAGAPPEAAVPEPAPERVD